MDFPRRIAQHKSESDSFAIMIYQLRELGIFRNMTDNDYGIDFELELVEKGEDQKDRVKGHCVKIQVKGSPLMSKVHVEPSVPNIKQTTLNYWAELSFSMPVTAIAVDTAKEELFIADDLFWQATSLIDNNSEDKVLHFRSNANVKQVLSQLALGYSLPELISAHKWFLRNIRRCLDIITDWVGNDFFMEIDNPNELSVFVSMIENAKVLLLYNQDLLKYLKQQKISIDQFFSFTYHMQKADPVFSYQDAINFADILLPILMKEIETINNRILNATYYWAHKEPSYLRDVIMFQVPPFSSVKELFKIITKFYEGKREYSYNTLSDCYFEVSNYFEKVAGKYGCSGQELFQIYYSHLLKPILATGNTNETKQL